ncbi:MAG: TfoX/Sxy family DNA transformation protein [Pseudomonadota bacterium]
MTGADPITAISNLGPAMARAFADAGIADAEALRALGADAAYARLLAAGTRPHFMAFLAVTLGLQGRPWNDADAQEKAALRARFDALRATAASRGANTLEAQLDALGVPRAP